MNNLFRRLLVKIKKENLIYRYSVLIVTMFVGAINYNLFLSPLKIVAGGTNGIAIILENIFNLDPSLFILLFSIAILIIAYFTVGIEKASSAVVSAFVYPLFVKATAFLSSYVVIDYNDSIIAVIFAAMLTGWVSGFTCKVNLSQGGITLINQILYEKFRLSLSKSNFFVNMIIVIIGGYYFGIQSIMFAVILLYISSIVIDKVLLGVSTNKVFHIVTDKVEDMKKYITNDIEFTLIYYSTTGNIENDKGILLVTVSNEEYYRLKKNIKLIDSKVFFVATDAYEVNSQQ